MELFDNPDPSQLPLATRNRPATLSEIVGQEHLLGDQAPLRRLLKNGHIPSCVLYGPTGTGKTTLAKLMASELDAHWHDLNAVTSGATDIKKIVEQANSEFRLGRKTILFIDEIHRFNRAQQDLFLPAVESGILTLIGATTENPAFELNNALLSRVVIYRLNKLSVDELIALLKKIVQKEGISIVDEDTTLKAIANVGGGDARRSINVLEMLHRISGSNPITTSDISSLGEQLPHYDKSGDLFYDLISAFHKSIRGSDPDAALYWMCRIIEGGGDPLYIARRLVRIASEDIGNADPRALTLCLNAWDVQQRLGSPEGELTLAQATTYLACAPKSNASYVAYKRAIELVKSNSSSDVPTHLVNRPLEQSDASEIGYRYAHDEPSGFVAGEDYLPTEINSMPLYEPVSRGLESKIADKLQYLKELNRNSAWHRSSRIGNNRNGSKPVENKKDRI